MIHIVLKNEDIMNHFFMGQALLQPLILSQVVLVCYNRKQ